MKNFIIKAFMMAGIILCIAGCGNTKRLQRQEDNSIYGGMYGIEQMMSRYQVDSMCVADTLGMLNNWFASTYVDYETGIAMTKYTYVKIYSENSEIIYVVAPKGEMYKITKRIISD